MNWKLKISEFLGLDLISYDHPWHNEFLRCSEDHKKFYPKDYQSIKWYKKLLVYLYVKIFL